MIQSSPPLRPLCGAVSTLFLFPALALATPDLHVNSFKVSVNDRTLTYEVEVCNKGSTFAGNSALELYANLTNTPSCGLQHSWRYLLPQIKSGECKSFKQIESGSKPGSFTAWALIDADCSAWARASARPSPRWRAA